MTHQPSEVVTLEGAHHQTFTVLRRGYELQTANPRIGETVFTALGEYAICHTPEAFEAPWQFVPGEQNTTYDEVDHSLQSYRWANAETLRTEAAKGAFLPEHMDLLDASLFREQRVTSIDTKLTIHNEEELRHILEASDVPIAQWSDAKVRNLLYYTRSNDPSRSNEEVENMALHNVDGTLWLATAQTMLNVYHQAATGQVYKLRETWKTLFDSNGQSLDPVRSKIRSSMGETGHLISSSPERAWVTARRCLSEELGIDEDDVILSMVSIGSLLRQKRQGHHQFFPIAAEDRTHYFDVELNPKKVEETYTNLEYDPDGKLRASILLRWFEHDRLPSGNT